MSKKEIKFEKILIKKVFIVELYWDNVSFINFNINYVLKTIKQ